MDGDTDCLVRFRVGIRIGSFGAGCITAGGWVLWYGEGGIGKERVVVWLRGGLKSGFGVFIFEALDHALEGGVEEFEPFL